MTLTKGVDSEALKCGRGSMGLEVFAEILMASIMHRSGVQGK
jgi:hypothetical protein